MTLLQAFGAISIADSMITGIGGGNEDCKLSLQVGSLTGGMIAVLTAFVIVFSLLTPVFGYSDVYNIPVRYSNSNTSRQVTVIRKCGYNPPAVIAVAFNLYACLLGYVVPTVCFVCFYLSVLVFLKRHVRHAAISTGKAGRCGTKVST